VNIGLKQCKQRIVGKSKAAFGNMNMCSAAEPQNETDNNTAGFALLCLIGFVVWM